MAKGRRHRLERKLRLANRGSGLMERRGGGHLLSSQQGGERPRSAGIGHHGCLPHHYCGRNSDRSTRRGIATEDALSRAAGLGRRSLVGDRFHGLPIAFLPHAERATECEREFLRRKWRSRREWRRWHVSLRNQRL